MMLAATERAFLFEYVPVFGDVRLGRAVFELDGEVDDLGRAR